VFDELDLVLRPYWPRPDFSFLASFIDFLAIVTRTVSLHRFQDLASAHLPIKITMANLALAR